MHFVSTPDASIFTDAPRKGIVWLASYPKSGNTWFRIFLRNLLHESPEDEDLGGILGISSDRELFDEFTGLDSSNMTEDEIEAMRPTFYEEFVGQSDSLPVFMKAHDAYTFLPNGEPLFSTDATAGAIYFLRNPFDVAVSMAYHVGHEIFARAVETMGSAERCIASSSHELKSQLQQRLLDWSGHVRSWVDQKNVPVHVLRYEDMLARPLETFRGAIRFAGLDHDDEQIGQALEESRFERLQQIERDRGFRERCPGSKSLFFRQGKSGTWRTKLTIDLVTKLIADHADVMRRFGYLDENNAVLV